MYFRTALSINVYSVSIVILLGFIFRIGGLDPFVAVIAIQFWVLPVDAIFHNPPLVIGIIEIYADWIGSVIDALGTQHTGIGAKVIHRVSTGPSVSGKLSCVLVSQVSQFF
jgi:hypothetical protein